ncbi:hypothetical protein PU630_05920 [Microbacterium horticulturae]|uniref:Uncharacterized protein n=1 Tax=Microbacterium horticulturae TaxID=3028316 RepID=A0ABY8C409_9MICO|nr:hypothetical protein [Microbacterium sp. KACC 23027]WEG10087.1 hypothetical protein PU630_05920 [Microbacterium sp. KACC 23027]
MTHHPTLKATLTLRHAIEVKSIDEASTLAASADAEDTDHLYGYISERGRVLAWTSPAGEHLLYEGAIRVADDYEWTPIGTPRIYRFDTTDRAEIHGDALRLFLSQSLNNGGVRRSGGWRDRIVALVPEEVGAKESKIIRTLADGGIEATHTYNVLDAYTKYAEWVNALAAEFGGTDEKLEAHIETPDIAPFSPIVAGIAQAWLLREAADAALEQTRASLKFSLAGFTRLLELAGNDSRGSVAELARSLQTDRPNLTRMIKTAEKDARIAEILDSLPR